MILQTVAYRRCPHSSNQHRSSLYDWFHQSFKRAANGNAIMNSSCACYSDWTRSEIYPTKFNSGTLVTPPDPSSSEKFNSNLQHCLRRNRRERERDMTLGTMTQAYGEPSYWDNRYAQEPGPFDWYQKYPALAPLLHLYIPTHHRVLVVGCGNSAFRDDGYVDVVNIDISSVAIEAMRKKCSNRPQLKCIFCLFSV
ncbi:uncharacterized protein LOC130763369 [Actinidia eriantha]|uniref:uncharacterized protein LOC130763369 n=1 Tax=Actinidia eriantha TaxID=165200 RepID=UPI0025865A9D|nr:uncharacterized protein LOC130763369 [Actinidia eriantha]XP_057475257.1 uncharacterized protein LOC130763369 [Actinidia eriantha]